MHYWRREAFLSLKEAAWQASALGWNAYAEYCLERERGLRDRSLTALNEFMKDMEHATAAERQRFASWILSLVEYDRGSYLLMPQPLLQNVIHPTLQAWVESEPDNPEPHRWIGDNDHLERALELDPADQIARYRLIILLLSRISRNAHELPRGYLGSIPEDLAVLDRVGVLLPGLLDKKHRDVLMEAAEENRVAIELYLRRQRE